MGRTWKGQSMKRRTTLFYVLAFVGVMAAALMLTGMSNAGQVANPPAARALQDTVVVTVQVTPQVTVVPGTVVVPATGGGQAQPLGGSWLFLAILVVAGLAFLVAIVALMRRPYP
jgi:hypothetical protein